MTVASAQQVLNWCDCTSCRSAAQHGYNGFGLGLCITVPILPRHSSSSVCAISFEIENQFDLYSLHHWQVGR